MNNNKLNFDAFNEYFDIEVRFKDTAKQLTKIMLNYIYFFGNAKENQILTNSDLSDHTYLLRRLRDLMIITAKQNGETDFDELLLLDDTQYLKD